jgi:hypothetical protein
MKVVLSLANASNPYVIAMIVELFQSARPDYQLFMRTYAVFMIYLVVSMVMSVVYTYSNVIILVYNH